VQAAAVELPLPCQESGRNGWNRRHRGNQQIVISSRYENGLPAQLSCIVESNPTMNNAIGKWISTTC
jgi:hypothetical protein